MQIKFGALTNPMEDILDEIKLIEKLGFDFVELGMELPEGSPAKILKDKKNILELLSRFKIPAIVHTAWWIDFGSGYDLVRKVWIDEAEKCIDASEAVGIDKINFHLFSVGLSQDYRKAYHKELLDNIIASLKKVVNYTSLKKITVLLENVPVIKSILGIDEYKFVIDSVPKLKVHLDIGHAFVENGMTGIKDYIFTFKDKIEHIHVHDNHGEDEHLPLGRGNIDFKQVAKWLKQINYDKTITFEIFTNKEDAKSSMIKFKKMLSE